MAKQWNQEIKAKVIARAWKDDAFRKKLMSNPHEALKEFGVTLDKKVHFEVCKEDPTHLFFVLPKSPVNVHELSVAELEQIAAAGGAIDKGKRDTIPIEAGGQC